MIKRLIAKGQANVKRHCHYCGKATKATITEMDEWEIWRCQVCGAMSKYKVR